MKHINDNKQKKVKEEQTELYYLDLAKERAKREL